jgi:hypothetical protein
MVVLRSIGRWLASVGGLLAVVAPKGLCPICVAASGGMLTSLGLGFLAVEQSVRWILIGTLTIGLVGLVLSARGHRRYWPLGLGALGASLVIVGRFLGRNELLYGGMVLLLGATLGDLWARRHPWTPLVQIRLTKRGA